MAADQSVNRGENLDTPGRSPLLLGGTNCALGKESRAISRRITHKQLRVLPDALTLVECESGMLNQIINDTESVSGEIA